MPVDGMEALGGLRVCQREAGGGVSAKNPKPSVCSLASGVLCETAVWGDNGRWWVPVDGMEVLGGLCICQHEAGAGV